MVRHYESSFDDGWMEKLIKLLMFVLVGLLGLMVFTCVDSIGITPTETAVTVVEVKQVVPAHTTFVLVGKVIVPQHHPESYQLYFKINGEEVSFTVEKKFFDDINVGDRIEVDYGYGRLSNSYKLTGIRLVGR